MPRLRYRLPMTPITAMPKASGVHRRCRSGACGAGESVDMSESLIERALRGSARFVNARNAVRQDDVLVRLGCCRRQLLVAEGQLPFAASGGDGRCIGL